MRHGGLHDVGYHVLLVCMYRLNFSGSNLVFEKMARPLQLSKMAVTLLLQLGAPLLLPGPQILVYI